tara:strand:+ start:618 stop:1361 length:744 start_codon:yes stop_codon:yes gene_type:complete
VRYFIKFSYVGTSYHGFQYQPNAITVQEEINKALSILFNKSIEITGASRTDAGVHAQQMYAHVDIQDIFDIEKAINNLNGILSKDIAISDIFQVRKDANSRFDAISRTYNYYIINNKDVFNPYAYILYKNLDFIEMNKACEHIIGEKDFSSFAKSKTQTYTNICNVKNANWRQEGGVLIFTIKSNRFLRNMVRAIVGTLIKVGEGKISAESIKDLLLKKDRSCAGQSVPANALFLTNIEYPKDINNV